MSGEKEKRKEWYKQLQMGRGAFPPGEQGPAKVSCKRLSARLGRGAGMSRAPKAGLRDPGQRECTSECEQ